jgi:hypothetical protein
MAKRRGSGRTRSCLRWTSRRGESLLKPTAHLHSQVDGCVRPSYGNCCGNQNHRARCIRFTNDPSLSLCDAEWYIIKCTTRGGFLAYAKPFVASEDPRHRGHAPRKITHHLSFSPSSSTTSVPLSLVASRWCSEPSSPSSPSAFNSLTSGDIASS